MRRLGLLLVLVVAFLLYLVSLLEAKVFYVSNPQEFQNALNEAASNGEDDTIYVAPGTYNITQTLTYQPSQSEGSLTIVAQDLNNPPVLDGLNAVRILYINTKPNYNISDKNKSIIIKGLIFKNGKDILNLGKGGAICIEADQANVYIDKCKFINNIASYSGGAVNINSGSSQVIILNSEFYENYTNFNGGGVNIYIYYLYIQVW